MFVIASRLVLALLGGIGAFQAAGGMDLSGQFGAPWHLLATAGIALIGALAGWVLGGVLGRWMSSRLSVIDRAADGRPAGELIVGAFGLVVGLLVAVLAGFAVLQLPTIGPYLLLPVVLLVAYVFSRIAARKHVDILRLVGIRAKGARAGEPTRVIDTSALIDGRIIDVAKTRFLSGQLIVPDVVLEELQHIADSSDHLKRARGRRGLELVDELKTSANGGFQVRNIDYPDLEEVDAKLVRLAQDLDASLVTTDFNLNKLATLQGIEVLNVNDLANALRPAVLPGEPLSVRVIREGKEYDQGVGYLDDGTMVVIEGGRPLVGSTTEVEVTSVLQNPSGKMIFARPVGS